MPNVPKRKATATATPGNKGGSGSTFKKSASSSTLGSRADTKLNQPSLSSFFAKVRPIDLSAAKTTAPVSKDTSATSTSAAAVSRPAVTVLSESYTAPARQGVNATRTIIIDSDCDDGAPQQALEPKLKPLMIPMKRPKPELTSKTPASGVQHFVASALPKQEANASFADIPFEERMPVSPPGSPALSAIVAVIPSGELEAPLDNQEAQAEALPKALVDASLSLVTRTPPKQTISQTNVTPKKAKESRPSPFRTPTEKSRRSLSTMESLGLSPQDSVFWVRTPPSEALKKLERLNSGRSHEEEIASIVGRLYETSSAGTALRTMSRGPKDRIKDMLNTIRGSSTTSFQGLEDEIEDLERIDPVSPTKELLDRQKGTSAYRQGFVRHSSAQELGNTARRRGRITRTMRLPESSLSTQLTSPSKCREDVLKMIEQINANMAGPSQQSGQQPEQPREAHRSRRMLFDTIQSRSTSPTPPPLRTDVLKISNSRPIASDSVPRTPLINGLSKAKQQQQQPSPGEFDQFFTELEMDDDDFEELTQLELSSASMNSGCSVNASISCASSSTETCASKSFSTVRREFSVLDMDETGNTTLLNDQDTPFITRPKVETPSDDDFDDIGDLGDDFEIENEVDSNAPQQIRIDSRKYRRFRVSEVKEDVADTRWCGRCKVLLVNDASDQTQARIFLRESWVASLVVPGDIVHTVRAFVYSSDALDLVFDDAQGYLIVKPDSLVPTSALAESFNCIRKPIIDIRARKTDESTVPLIHGTMLHELFQQSLRTNDFSTATMEARIDDLIQVHLNDLCLVNESIDVAKETISQQISSCQEWAQRYLKASPSADGTVEEAAGQTLNGNSNLLCVNRVLDIEENIWSPMFGLKGKIDASIQVVLKTVKKNAGPNAAETRTLTVPFELKTGKKSNVVSHRAQTMLYTLLMTDRYDVDVQWGLLFYLKTGELIRVPAPHDEMRTILMQRNEIAAYEEDKLTLPPMARSTQRCGRCFSFSSCTVLHKLLEGGTAETSGLGTMFEEATDHLNETHAGFLRKWNRLLSLEQGNVAKFQSQIWSMLSLDRQAAGNCLSNLLLLREQRGGQQLRGASTADLDIAVSGRFASHRYSFKIGAPPTSLSQQTLSQTLRGGHSLLSSNISVGDPIVLSSEAQHYALAIGQVLDMTLSEVTVGLDRPLLGPPMRTKAYDPEWNQSYRGLIELDKSSSLPGSCNGEDYHSELEKNNITFRIDKDEMTAGIARTRNNLVQLFRSEEAGGDSKRRRLIVDMERPTFEPLSDFKHQDPHLNDDQRRAVEAVLSAKDYALILGMPGTGKTTTIAHIIHTLVAQGNSVLLSSYTHSAVDNVLLKLRSDINIVRLGNKDKVHRDIQSLIPDFSEPPMNTVQAIHNFYGNCQVVGTTCLGIGDPLFTEKRFDYCIIDEASQITLPACLGPIRYADVFVLVGDHNQLPPLVKNPEAKKDGFDLSLFKLLSDRYPEAVTSLTQQYRMNKDVMLLSNTLVYENRLQCATEQVANKVLEIPAMENFRQYCHPASMISSQDETQISDSVASTCSSHTEECPCWLEQILDPQRSVVFVDTDGLPAHEVQVGNSTQNPTEALLIRQLTEALISGGISEHDIGIISVLRAQLKVLSRLLRGRPLLDIHTVDRYQGKDKECVIVSLVRSNSDQHVGELLKDWRRINVAFTRAKRKLVVFGSRQTLQGSPIFEQFLQLMEQQHWIMRLAPLAQYQHPSLSRALAISARSMGGSEATTMVRHGHVASPKKKSLAALVEDRDCNDVEDDKENIHPEASMLDSGAKSRSKEAKVSWVKAEVVLKRMPIVKNVIDSL